MTDATVLTRPNPAVLREALQWGYRDALREHGELLESLGVSLREAAYRGDDVTARAHVMQARLVVIDAVAAVSGVGAAKNITRAGCGMTEPLLFAPTSTFATSRTCRSMWFGCETAIW